MTSGEPSPGTAAGPLAIRRCFGRLLVVLTATLAVVAGVLGSAPAPVAVAVAHYDTVAHSYETSALLSTPSAATARPRASPAGPRAVSGKPGQAPRQV